MTSTRSSPTGPPTPDWPRHRPPRSRSCGGCSNATTWPSRPPSSPTPAATRNAPPPRRGAKPRPRSWCARLSSGPRPEPTSPERATNWPSRSSPKRRGRRRNARPPRAGPSTRRGQSSSPVLGPRGEGQAEECWGRPVPPLAALLRCLRPPTGSNWSSNAGWVDQPDVAGHDGAVALWVGRRVGLPRGEPPAPSVTAAAAVVVVVVVRGSVSGRKQLHECPAEPCPR